MWRRRHRLLVATIWVLIASSGCQLFVDSEIGAGIGAPCEQDNDCHASQCVDEVCTIACDAAANCPAPTRCTSRGLCELPLRVGFVYVGNPEVQQWTQAHEAGRLEAASALPYLESDFATDKLLASDAVSAIDDFIARGYEIIVTNSSNLSDAVATQAAEHPGVKFLTCGSPIVSQNHVSYYARMYQATYLAGYAAGQRSTTKRLGMIGSYVTPAVVRHINAFATGARRADSSVVVEVRWIGFWHDLGPPNGQLKKKERVLTEELIATGCDVIAHQADNGIPVATIDELSGPVKAIGNNVPDSCPEGSITCLGATYWQWGPLYTKLFDDLHRSRWPAGTFVNSSIQIDPSASIVNFGLNTTVGTANLAIELSEILEELASDTGIQKPFEGPLCSTGQRDMDGDSLPDCLAAGDAVTDQELQQMCWFVDGIVEKEDLADPASNDRAALVPTEGDCKQ